MHVTDVMIKSSYVYVCGFAVALSVPVAVTHTGLAELFRFPASTSAEPSASRVAVGLRVSEESAAEPGAERGGRRIQNPTAHRRHRAEGRDDRTGESPARPKRN